ncbi:MAG: glycosyltransferase [Thermus sp.]|uniref:glycosyltransferase n=1 Tax=Thermus sp. TaxID=275 RepID=UPI003919B4CF
MPDLHVLFLPSWYSSKEQPSSGIFFKRQALALSRAGVRVGLIYPELVFSSGTDRRSSFLIDVSAQEDEIVEMRLTARVSRPLRPFARYWAARKLLAEYQRRFGAPHLVHAHGALWAGVIASFLPVPYVLTEHWSGYGERIVKPWQVPLIRRAFGRARASMAVSSALANDLRFYIGNVNIEVVPNVVDTNFFRPPSRPPAYPPLRLLSVALLNRPKRLDLAIRALAHLVRWGMDVELDLGGDGPQRGELERLAHQLGVEGRVRFLGHLSPEGVRRAMHNAHIFVLPSEYETFGVVYAEALACGLPVIATDRGGPKDFVIPEVGRLVPPGDEVALANAIAEMWKNHEQYDPNRLHDYAERRFSESAVAIRLIAIYDSVRTTHGEG